MSNHGQPAKHAQGVTPELTKSAFTLTDLIRLAEGCTSLQELNDKLREVKPRQVLDEEARKP